MVDIKQTLENALYAYDPQEFLPIFYDGELQNKGEFVAYKAERAAAALGRAAYKASAALLAAGAVVLEHIGQDAR